MLDLAAASKLTERQQVQYLLTLTAAESFGCARTPLAETTTNAMNKPTQQQAATTITTAKSAAGCCVAICLSPPDLSGLDGSGVSLVMLDKEDKAALSDFKKVADDLLPYMRRDAHLHHLIFSPHSHTLVVRDPSDQNAIGCH